ncbi:hypothetical protein T459_24623 [Capsicum annuum]|uniref:At4g15545-like C-terminal domain-containing protein n=1 Tax=Capsicum annuum TaxID=4072 RepID=A0A2G2YIH7_CAPAN|nr:hypothetical protein T459_24623 [Capsicum annuum]
MAIASRVNKLEMEMERLCEKVNEKDRVIVELQDKVSQLEKACHEAELRLKFTCEDNQAETVDIGTYDQSTHKAYSVKEEVNSYGVHHSFSGSTDSTVINDDASKRALQRFSMTPNYITPRLTPTGTPKIVSTSVSPRRYSVAESPQRISGANSPTSRQYDGRGSMSSFFPSSQQSSAANSPPKGRPLPGQTRIDGKEFFRQARSRLSYEQFSAFLTNIKELNAQKQSREETLRKAEEIFGMENKDLYLSFQGLLNRSAR